MTKQKEIREGIRSNLLVAIEWARDEGMTDSYLDMHVDDLVKDLKSKGVVIKRDMPINPYMERDGRLKFTIDTPDIAFDKGLKAAVEELI